MLELTALVETQGNALTSIIPQWESMGALLRDINLIQEQNQTANEQAWRTRHSVQNLQIQVNQTKATLAQSDLSLHNARAELHQMLMDLENEKGAHSHTKQALDHKTLAYDQVEEGLQYERNMNHGLVALCNKLDFTGPVSGSAKHRHVELGSILMENEAMKQALLKNKACADEKGTDNHGETIETLEKEKKLLIGALEEKKRELSELKEEICGSCESCDDDESVQIETATIGKRKRLGN